MLIFTREIEFDYLLFLYPGISFSSSSGATDAERQTFIFFICG